jgi:hypothetical protein
MASEVHSGRGRCAQQTSSVAIHIHKLKETDGADSRGSMGWHFPPDHFLVVVITELKLRSNCRDLLFQLLCTGGIARRTCSRTRSRSPARSLLLLQQRVLLITKLGNVLFEPDQSLAEVRDLACLSVEVPAATTQESRQELLQRSK